MAEVPLNRGFLRGLLGTAYPAKGVIPEAHQRTFVVFEAEHICRMPRSLDKQRNALRIKT
jgi:hypothetical protein